MSQDDITVLIVDDERSIRASLRTILSGIGFVVVEAARGEEAVSLARTAEFEVILLDINMPGMGGIETCRLIRENSPRLPILMLTVRGDEDSKVEALDAGADDYITKPFQLRELIARIRAAVRRTGLQDNSPDAHAVITIGELRLDPVRHAAYRNEVRIQLTPKQFELLHFLMQNAGRPVPHAQLLRSMWGPEYGNELEYLRTFIRQLRVKIEEDPAHPKYLLTESHIGYRFNESRPENQ